MQPRQLEEAAEPVEAKNVPAAQLWHPVVPLELWYWPIGQLVQAEAPAALEKLPGAHAAHDAEAVAPSAELDVPAAQLTHVDDTDAPVVAE